MKPAVWIGIGIGIGVGVGMAILSPSLFTQASRNARPQAKNLSKSAVRAYMQAREGVAHFGEYVDDLMAEAKAEVVEERRAAAHSAAEDAFEGAAEDAVAEAPQKTAEAAAGNGSATSS